MILKNNLYTIKETDREGRRAVLDLRPGSMIYRAHFPEQPVTPGVCIVQMATETLSELTGRGLRLTKVGNAKFLSVIDPRETPQIEIAFRKVEADEAAGILKATAQVSHGGKVYTKLSLTYAL